LLDILYDRDLPPASSLYCTYPEHIPIGIAQLDSASLIMDFSNILYVWSYRAAAFRQLLACSKRPDY
jgi:hypothetical protein